MNGKNAFVCCISPNQVNILTPPDTLTGTVTVQATRNDLMSNVFPVTAKPLSPSFFVFNGGPYVIATHVDGSLIGPAALFPGASTPAQPGETVVLYANGFGPTSVPLVNGSVTQSGDLSPLPVITIGGLPATVQFAGLVAPGEFQFNVVVPANAPSGDNPLIATHNGAEASPAAAITVQGSAPAPASVTFLMSHPPVTIFGAAVWRHRIPATQTAPLQPSIAPARWSAGGGARSQKALPKPVVKAPRAGFCKSVTADPKIFAPSFQPLAALPRRMPLARLLPWGRMGTPAQNAANLLNAQKSTGPRSDAGKAASRFNALQHGMDARSAVIPGEDAAEFEALSRNYRRENRPSGPEEAFLVETLIQADWNRRRYALIETQLMHRLLDELEPCEHPLATLFAANNPASRMLDRVIRHREAAERAWFRAFKELQRLQKARRLRGLPDSDAASDAAEASVLSENWVRSLPFGAESPALPAPAPHPVPDGDPAAPPPHVGRDPLDPLPRRPRS